MHLRAESDRTQPVPPMETIQLKPGKKGKARDDCIR